MNWFLEYTFFLCSIFVDLYFYWFLFVHYIVSPSIFGSKLHLSYLQKQHKLFVDSHLQYVLRNIKISFLDRGLLITKKLLNHGFLLVNLLIYHNPDLSSFMTYSPVCNRSNTTRAPRGAGTAYPSGASEFIHGFIGVLVAQSLVFCVVLYRLLFVFISFWPLYWLLITTWIFSKFS
jgi:hypothetical protein